jgi:hypothetical protein
MRMELAFWKEYCLALNVFKWENIHFMKNSPIQLNWRDTCLSWKNTIYVRSSIVFTMFTIWELIYQVKWIFSICQRFQLGERYTLCKIPLFGWIEETRASLRKIPVVLKAKVYSTCFSMRTEWAVKRMLPICQHF